MIQAVRFLAHDAKISSKMDETSS